VPCDISRAPDDNDGFDGCIDLKPAESSCVNLEKVIVELHRLFSNLISAVPSAEDMDATIEGAAPSTATSLSCDASSLTVAVALVVSTADLRGGGPAAQTAGKKEKKKLLEYMGVDVLAKNVLVVFDKVFSPFALTQTWPRGARQSLAAHWQPWRVGSR